MKTGEKLRKLQGIISDSGSCLVAFSGGTDSAFLLKTAAGILPKGKVLAVTASSATYPKEELLLAQVICRKIGARHKVIRTQELKNRKFLQNPLNRCYFCKQELFRRLKDIAKKSGLRVVFDASNASDKEDFRPGRQAKEELGIRSPLEEAGLTKKEIRLLSRRMQLVTWDKPSLACLASRFPYGTKITLPLLRRVNRAEVFLRGIGLKQVRLRHYNGLCRIEVCPKDLPLALRKRKAIVERLKDLGYNYIALDLEGYRTGSLNEAVNAGTLLGDTSLIK